MRSRIRTNSQGKREVVTANFGGGGVSRGGNAAGSSQSTSYLLGADLKSGILQDIIDEKTPHQLQAIYRDIYMHDPVAGGAVDLKATLPWSDYTLTGGDDEVLDVYKATLDRLNVTSLNPELSTDQMVSGAFVASLAYDPKVKGLTDIIPYQYADCEIQPVPLYSTDPIIRLNVNAELKAFATDQSEEAKRIQKRVPPQMLEHFRSSKQVDLDPLATLYVPRTTLSTLQMGVSYYRRITPIYLLERVLYRGTISEATRRQRATLHIQAGDEDWLPNEDELTSLVGLFQSTEQDPISAVVATRHNVITQEIRTGGDFWKWTDVTDQLNNMKMQALGINETFLSGDASYNTMETALSVFIESLRSYRDTTVRQTYTNKIFPLIAGVNEFYVDTDRNKSDKQRAKEQAYLQDVNYRLNDGQNLLIPEMVFHKALRPEADADFMGIMSTLKNEGLPITLRMWAAAGGINIEKLVDDLEEDKKLRAQIAKYQQAAEDNHDFEGAAIGHSMMARLEANKSLASKLLGRDYGEAAEVYKRTVTGKKEHVPSAAVTSREERINADVAKALASLSDPNNFQLAFSRRRLLPDA